MCAWKSANKSSHSNVTNGWIYLYPQPAPPRTCHQLKISEWVGFDAVLFYTIGVAGKRWHEAAPGTRGSWPCCWRLLQLNSRKCSKGRKKSKGWPPPLRPSPLAPPKRWRRWTWRTPPRCPPATPWQVSVSIWMLWFPSRRQLGAPPLGRKSECGLWVGGGGRCLSVVSVCVRVCVWLVCILLGLCG